MYWLPIEDLMEKTNVSLSDDLYLLYQYTESSARARSDGKLPVNLDLLHAQLDALENVLTDYRLALARAVLSTAWLMMLRISEYTSAKRYFMGAGKDDHNLRSSGVCLQKNGLTVIFESDKTSHARRERFIKWEDIPIKGYKEIMQLYVSLRNKSAPTFFCLEDGSNLTPNEMADWITMSVVQTPWARLRFSSHSYRIGGTSYHFVRGLDILNLQRNGRWRQGDGHSVEHYIKPGLYSATPEEIYETWPQYHASYKKSRFIYLKDKVTKDGKRKKHPYNRALKKLGFAELRCDYPTVWGKKAMKWMAAKKASNEHLQELLRQQLIKSAAANRRQSIALTYRKQRRLKKSLAPVENSILDREWKLACDSCQEFKKEKVQLNRQLTAMALDLQKSEGSSINVAKLKTKIQKLETKLEARTVEMEQLQYSLKVKDHELNLIRQENINCRRDLADAEQRCTNLRAEKSVEVSKPVMKHAQVRCDFRNMGNSDEGRIMFPSNKVLTEIAEKKIQQGIMDRYDLMGESVMEAKNQLRTKIQKAIRYRLSMRHRIHRCYRAGKSKAKKRWVVKPSYPGYNRSMHALVLSTFYNCCKKGMHHFPQPSKELDPLDTDDEVLEKLQKQGHTYKTQCYQSVDPDPDVWLPFLKSLGTKRSQAETMSFQVHKDVGSQFICGNTEKGRRILQDIKELHHDKAALKKRLERRKVQPEAIQVLLSQYDLAAILAKVSNARTHERHHKPETEQYQLLPDLFRVPGSDSTSKKATARRARRIKKQKEAFRQHKKVYVINEGDDYLQPGTVGQKHLVPWQEPSESEDEEPQQPVKRKIRRRNVNKNLKRPKYATKSYGDSDSSLADSTDSGSSSSSEDEKPQVDLDEVPLEELVEIDNNTDEDTELVLTGYSEPLPSPKRDRPRRSAAPKQGACRDHSSDEEIEVLDNKISTKKARATKRVFPSAPRVPLSASSDDEPLVKKFAKKPVTKKASRK